MKKMSSNEELTYNGSVTIRDVIEKDEKEGRGIKITHDEGYFTFLVAEKDGIVYINKFIYDFINDNWYTKTVCEVTDGKEVQYQIRKEIYRE